MSEWSDITNIMGLDLNDHDGFCDRINAMSDESSHSRINHFFKLNAESSYESFVNECLNKEAVNEIDGYLRHYVDIYSVGFHREPLFSVYKNSLLFTPVNLRGDYHRNSVKKFYELDPLKMAIDDGMMLTNRSIEEFYEQLYEERN